MTMEDLGSIEIRGESATVSGRLEWARGLVDRRGRLFVFEENP